MTLTNLLFTSPVFTNPKISLAARGTFITMAALPECDYLTFEQICDFFPASTPHDVKKALDELCGHQYLIHPNENKNIYAVNKHELIKFIAEKECSECQN